MKTFGFKNLVLGMTVMIMTNVANAALVSEKWAGEGALFGHDGAQMSSYKLELTKTEIGPDETRHDVVVTTATGTVLKFSQVARKSGNGFRIVGDTGNGGGYCFGEGLCQIYIEQNDTAYATTLVKDGDTVVRLMRTELKNGQATRFFREKLNRIF